MSAIQKILFYIATAFVVVIFPVNSAPFVGTGLEKFTCLHKSEAAKIAHWKQCTKIGDILSLDRTGLDIPNAITENRIDVLNVPQNSFKCFRTSVYGLQSLGTDCPALCRLRDMVEEETCNIGDLFYKGFLEKPCIATAKSPRYDCSDNYFKNEICVYNISMPCSSSHITISEKASEIDLAEGDSLHIIDYANQRDYEPVSGQVWPETHRNILTSDFLMVFLSNGDSKRGKGFNIQLECPTLVNNKDDTNDEGKDEIDGSGYPITVSENSY